MYEYAPPPANPPILYVKNVTTEIADTDFLVNYTQLVIFVCIMQHAFCNMQSQNAFFSPGKDISTPLARCCSTLSSFLYMLPIIVLIMF